MQLGGALAAAACDRDRGDRDLERRQQRQGGSAKGPAVGKTQTAQLLKGIPQSGTTLGSPKAPVTLTEFADLQCPFCKQYTLQTFPTIVAKYVRSGKVKMVFRNYAFISGDSLIAARAAEAAGKQNKLWNFIDVFYNNQGEEKTGYVTDPFLTKIANGAGVDASKMLTDRTEPDRRHGDRRGAAGGAAGGRELDPDVPHPEGQRGAEEGERVGVRAWTSSRRRSTRRSPDLSGVSTAPVAAEEERARRPRLFGSVTGVERKLMFVIAGIALVGVGIATYLVYVHYAGIQPFCVSGGGGCEKVQTSDFAKLAGHPGRRPRPGRLPRDPRRRCSCAATAAGWRARRSRCRASASACT